MARRPWIDRRSLGTKISLIGLLASGIALSLASAALIGYELMTYEPRQRRELTRISEVVADTLSAAVVFSDTVAVDEIIGALADLPEIYVAGVYDVEGIKIGLMVQPARGLDAVDLLEAPPDDMMTIETPISIDGELVGTLRLVAGRDGLRTAILRYVGIVAVVFWLSLGIAVIVTALLKPTVLRPVAELSAATERIRRRRDYSARVRPFAEDELGALTEGFNRMLEEIQRHEASLGRAAEEMALAKEAAESANAIKTKFIANMSHELRTPLNAIIGYAEILREDLEDAHAMDEVADADRILGAAQHLLGLINEVLDIAKIESGRLELAPEMVDLQALFRDAVETVRPVAQKNGNSLDLQVDGALGMAQFDPKRLQQCLLNLLSNAAKFTENGTISVAVKRRADLDRQCLEIAVRDNGIGMSEDQLSRLFVPFTQVDNSATRRFGGTGLGLVITRSIARLMGGDVAVQSEPDVGSTFTLTLPFADAGVAEDIAEPALAETPLPLPQEGGQQQEAAARWRLLVIDDEADARELVRRWFAWTAIDVVTAASVDEGIDMAERLRPDLVLLDIKMPDSDGWNFMELRRQRPRLAEIPVIMVTVADDRPRALAADANELVVKPVDRIALMQLVMAHMPADRGRVAVLSGVGGNDGVIASLQCAGYTTELIGQPLPSASAPEALALVIDESVAAKIGADAIAAAADVPVFLLRRDPSFFGVEPATPGVRYVSSIGGLLMALADLDSARAAQ